MSLWLQRSFLEIPRMKYTVLIEVRKEKKPLAPRISH